MEAICAASPIGNSKLMPSVQSQRQFIKKWGQGRTNKVIGILVLKFILFFNSPKGENTFQK